MVFQTLFLSNNLPPIGSFPFSIDHFSFISNHFFPFQKINSILCIKDKLTESHKLGICFNRTKKKLTFSFSWQKSPNQVQSQFAGFVFPPKQQTVCLLVFKRFSTTFRYSRNKRIVSTIEAQPEKLGYGFFFFTQVTNQIVCLPETWFIVVR